MATMYTLMSKVNWRMAAALVAVLVMAVEVVAGETPDSGFGLPY